MLNMAVEEVVRGVDALTFPTAAVPIQVQRLGGTRLMALCRTTPFTLLPDRRVAAVAGAVGSAGKKSYTTHLCKQDHLINVSTRLPPYLLRHRSIITDR